MEWCRGRVLEAQSPRFRRSRRQGEGMARREHKLTDRGVMREEAARCGDRFTPVSHSKA